jgi:hypothetical protein
MENYDEVLLEMLNEDNIDDAIEFLIHYLSTFEAS